jgi:hypothetical protein
VTADDSPVNFDEVDPVSNLKRNIEFTDHYLQHHSETIDEDLLERTKEKQEHRREQLSFLE